MEQLFGGDFSLITKTFGFLRSDAEIAAHAFVEWQRPIQRKRDVTVTLSRVNGGFADLLQLLLPLTSVERRRLLFIPTRSHWTAFLDNGHQGTDAFSPMSMLAQMLKCDGLRVTYDPVGEFPATIFEMYGPDKTHFLNYRRSISAAKDGAAWAFGASGELQPFEAVEFYSKKRIKDRFNGEILNQYLLALDIRAFDEHFYAPDKTAFLVEKFGKIALASREFRLQDVR